MRRGLLTAMEATCEAVTVTRQARQDGEPSPVRQRIFANLSARSEMAARSELPHLVARLRKLSGTKPVPLYPQRDFRRNFFYRLTSLPKKVRTVTEDKRKDEADHPKQ